LPFNAASSDAGPQVASISAQSASQICAAASSNPTLGGSVCSFFSISAPLIWGALILAVGGLIAAVVAWTNARRPRAAVVVILICGILTLLEFGYMYFAGQAVLPTLEQAFPDITWVAGFGSGGWLMIVGALGSAIGAIVQFNSH
jgi:hypothetical protein